MAKPIDLATEKKIADEQSHLTDSEIRGNQKHMEIWDRNAYNRKDKSDRKKISITTNTTYRENYPNINWEHNQK